MDDPFQVSTARKSDPVLPVRHGSQIRSNPSSGSAPAAGSYSVHSLSSESISPASNVPRPVTRDACVQTSLGGLLYLINVAMYLGLYPDFTRPLDQGLSLPIWDFIELVGRRMLSGKYRRDPIWTFLARLAGRESGDPPGKYFEPPDEWRIPAGWLKPFVGHPIWTWSVEHKRLRVWHRDGFCILDVSSESDHEKCLHREMSRYNGTADFVLRHGKRRSADKPSLERWLDWLVHYIFARTRLALGIDTSVDLAELLLCNRAELQLGDARIDVHFALADLPIKIRSAGLDRDPGWIPAAGRAVAFHFT